MFFREERYFSHYYIENKFFENVLHNKIIYYLNNNKFAIFLKQYIINNYFHSKCQY